MENPEFESIQDAAAAHHRERERLRLVAEALGGYAYDWDLSSGLVDRAADFAAFLGFDPADIPPDEHWWIDRIHPDDLAGPVAASRALFHDPSVLKLETEYRVRHRDGSWRWISDRGRLLRDGNGEVVRMVGITLDVTAERERQRRDREALEAAEAERRRQQEAQAILAQASAALGQSLDVRETAAAIARAALPRFADWAVVDAFDADGKFSRLAIAHVDPAMVDAAKELDRRWPPQLDLKGGLHRVIETGEPIVVSDVHAADFAPYAHDPEHMAAWRSFGVRSLLAVPLKTGGDVLGVLVLFATEGRRRYTAADLPLALELGRRCAIALINARLFELERRAHVEAQAARSEAEAANQTKSSFLAAMSHELRTPLNAIAGYTELLELGIHGPVTPEQQKALSRIQHSQRHLLSLINEVLNYARLEAGAVQYDITSIEVTDALRKAETFVLPLVHAKGLELSIGPCKSDLVVAADDAKLSQVLLNLLSNAVKFTGTGGRITVTCAQREDYVDIIVADSGIGISADQLERIFEPFVQVSRTLSNPHEGTGLGLAISRDLARGMGGELTATSRGVGKGSAFTLSLPIEKAGSTFA